jgi:hypothetical protein
MDSDESDDMPKEGDEGPPEMRPVQFDKDGSSFIDIMSQDECPVRESPDDSEVVEAG